MAAEARATGRKAAEEVRATTRGRDPGRRHGGREPTCSLAHAYYLRGGAIPPPKFTSRLLSHHSPPPSRLLSPCFLRPHFPALGLLYASMSSTSTVHAPRRTSTNSPKTRGRAAGRPSRSKVR